MKILFIMHYPPPIHGSAAIGGIIKTSGIINASFNCKYVNLGTSLTIREIGKNGLKKTFKYFSLIFQVIKQLILFRPDFCYLTPTAKGIGLYKDVIIIALVKIFRIKGIYHLHTKGVSKEKSSLIGNLLYHFTFNDSDVILLSEHLYPDIQKYVSREQVYYCPNGIPQTIFNTKHFNKNGIPEILFLSNLIESKGLHELINACRILKEKKVDFLCTIAGGEGDMTHLEVEDEIFRNGLELNIRTIAGVYGEEKQKILQTSDIFVFPSYYHNECMPLVLIEAMQYSLPIVSTFEGAIPDVVEDGKTGILVRQKDTIALADAMEKLICNRSLREELGKNGFRKYREQFTIEKFESRLTEILQEVGKK